MLFPPAIFARCDLDDGGRRRRLGRAPAWIEEVIHVESALVVREAPRIDTNCSPCLLQDGTSSDNRHRHHQGSRPGVRAERRAGVWTSTRGRAERTGALRTLGRLSGPIVSDHLQ